MAPVFMGRTTKMILSLGSFGAQQLLGIILTLVVVPLLVRYLSGPIYGVWLYLIQVAGYVSLMDVGHNSVLKLTLALHQTSSDFAAKRRQVGATIGMALMMMPIYILGGYILSTIIPRLLHIEASEAGAVSAAAMIMCLNLGLSNLLTIPNLVFRGSNLDYAAMPQQLGVTALSSVSDVLVVWAGGGLVGLALNKVFWAIVLCGIMALAVKRRLPWFGVDWPSFAELRRMLGLSGWSTLSLWGIVAAENTDLFLIGSFLGPGLVTTYALTAKPIKMLTSLSGVFVQAPAAGLGELCGANQNAKLRSVVLEMTSFLLGFLSVVACVLAISTGHFIALWVGQSYFAGDAVTLMLIACAYFAGLNRLQKTLLGVGLALKQLGFWQLGSSLLTFVACLALTPVMGLEGTALGSLLGCCCAALGYQMHLRRLLQLPAEIYLSYCRLAVISAVLTVGCFIVGKSIVINSWTMLAAVCTATAVLCGSLLWVFGFTASQRRMMVVRLKDGLSQISAAQSALAAKRAAG